MKKKTTAVKRKTGAVKLPSHRMVKDAEELWLDFYEAAVPVVLQAWYDWHTESSMKDVPPDVDMGHVAHSARMLADAQLEEYENRWMLKEPQA